MTRSTGNILTHKYPERRTPVQTGRVQSHLWAYLVDPGTALEHSADALMAWLSGLRANLQTKGSPV